MTHAEITEKVRKLLRLAQSSNQHEAALALEHAMRLAEEHKLDLDALSLDPETEKITNQCFPGGKRLSHIAKLALNVCTGFFHVSVVCTRMGVVFIGTASDVAISQLRLHLCERRLPTLPACV